MCMPAGYAKVEECCLYNECAHCHDATYIAYANGEEHLEAHAPEMPSLITCTSTCVKPTAILHNRHAWGTKKPATKIYCPVGCRVHGIYTL